MTNQSPGGPKSTIFTHHNLTSTGSDLGDPNALAVMDVDCSRKGEPIHSQVSSYRSSLSMPSSRIQLNPGQLKVEKTYAPMMAFNANLRYNHDEPQFAYYDPKEGKQ